MHLPITGQPGSCVLSRSDTSNSLGPHGLQPTRLHCPWDSPSKNTGVGSHSFLQEIFLTQRLNPGLLHFRQILYHLSQHIYTVLCLVAQSCLTHCDFMDRSLPGSSFHRDSPGKNTGVGCHTPLQGIFQTQESNPGLPQCRHILYHLSQ